MSSKTRKKPKLTGGTYAGVRVSHPDTVPAPTMARLCVEIGDILRREGLDRAGQLVFTIGGGV